MRQRGREAAANVVALNVSGAPHRLAVPSSLTTAERTLFAELIGACDARHFVRSDLPLLISYIQATLLARRLAVKLSKNDPSVVASWERAVRVQAMLATRLRLAPQARTDPKTIARMQQNGTAPWQQEERSEEW